MPETEVAFELFLAWLNEAYGRRFRLDAGGAALDGDTRLAIEVRPLLGPPPDDGWLQQRDRLQELLADGLPAAIALWIPLGAPLPSGEPVTSEFISRVRESAVKLGPRERAYVPLPATLLLRKTADTGGVVSVSGALNPFWARFTDRVRGTYDLDSTRMHRLPESEEHLEQLIDEIAAATAQLETGHVVQIDTIDAWTVQRLSGKSGVTIVGVPPSLAEDAGLAVRRNFRRLLAEAGPALQEQPADMRALLTLGHYARIEHEGATVAMRGYDPALYAGLDFVCLVTDGLVKPLIQAKLDGN